jgi:hypothetical protein
VAWADWTGRFELRVTPRQSRADYPNLLNATPQQLLDLGAVFSRDLDFNGMP